MRDPLTWSFPVGRVSGITVRVHLLFLFFTVGMVARGLSKNYAVEALAIQGILFLSVLLHEFGHCLAARQVDGDATEILLWPLGGLASVDIPNTPRAHLVTVLGGPVVNLLLCFAAAGSLLAAGLVPPMSPFFDAVHPAGLYNWLAGEETGLLTAWWQVLMARLFWINWMLFWFNVLLVGFPLDGGRILQCVVWRYRGYHQGTITAIFSGWIIALLLSLYVFITIEKSNGADSLMLFFLALFVYASCKQQFILLETGGLGEDNLFGYDFSQGYTSLERREAPARRRRPNFFQRWLQRRAQRKRQQEEELRQAEAARMDELLAKVASSGMQSLTDEERRFLTRVSARFRDRHQS
jgi:Zn-dependent protease